MICSRKKMVQRQVLYTLPIKGGIILAGAAKEKPEGEGAEAAADTEEAPVDLGDGNDMPEDLLDE